MENSEALVLFSELSRTTVESRLKVLVQLLLTKYGPTNGLWKWGRDRRASDKEEREHCSALAIQPRRYMRRGKTDCKLDLLELAIYARNIVPLT